MPEGKSSPGCLRNAVIPKSSSEPDNGKKAEVTRTTQSKIINHGDYMHMHHKQDKPTFISSILEHVETNPMSLWARPEVGTHQEPFGFDEASANIQNFADSPLTQAPFTSTHGTLPSSSLLHKYSNVSGVPQMDSRTVLSSAHDGSSTINSPTTTVKHSCNSPKPFTGIDDHGFPQPYSGKSTIPDPLALPRSFNTHFVDPVNPLMNDSGCHLTPADTIFHMHACDDFFLTEPLNDLSLFPSYGHDSSDQLNLSSNVLHKLAGGFGKDTSFQEQTDKAKTSLEINIESRHDDEVMQSFANTQDDSNFSAISSRGVTSLGNLYGLEPQALPAEYCSNTDSAVLDVLFDERSDSQSPKTSMKIKKGLHIDPTVKKPVESSKVVAELLADLLDDVDDVPYYMNEIESGLTLTPDAKEVGFMCEPNLSLASSWSPSAERDGIDARGDNLDSRTHMTSKQRSGSETRSLGLFGDEISKSTADDNQAFHTKFPYTMPPLADAFKELPSDDQENFPSSMSYNAGHRSKLGFSDIPAPPPLPPPAAASSPMKTPQQVIQGGSDRPLSGQDNITRKLNMFIQDCLKADRKCTLVSLLHRDMQTILQDGPSCGIVALAMTKDTLQRSDVSVDDILSVSKTRGYSAQGEMFSAFDMLRLAMEVFGCGGDVLDMEEGLGPREQLILHLINGHPCLVPYDSDRNHEPCLKKGHKAHWALLTGAVFVLSDEQAAYLSEDFTNDLAMPQLFHSRPDTDITTLHGVSRLAEDVLVYGRQGKSRHSGLWSLNLLLESNGQLMEVEPCREAEASSYILPKEGISQTLCNKIVVLWS